MSLPNWHGVEVVYKRATEICENLNYVAYRSQKFAYKRKTGFRFRPDPETELIIEARIICNEE